MKQGTVCLCEYNFSGCHVSVVGVIVSVTRVLSGNGALRWEALICNAQNDARGPSGRGRAVRLTPVGAGLENFARGDLLFPKVNPIYRFALLETPSRRRPPDSSLW